MRITSLVLAGALLAVAHAAAADPSEAAPSEAAATISQKEKVFDPREITIQRGETVVFRNDDPITHNVFSRTPGSQFNLKMQKPGQEDPVTFDEAGDVAVRCAIHPTMKLTIHVEEPGAARRDDATGE